MPVSIDCMSSTRKEPSGSCSFCMKTRFQISMNRSPSSSAEPGGPPQMWSPWSKKISVQGPQGPVGPIRQKLSSVGMRMMRSSGRPATFFQMPAASSSVW